MKRKLKLLIAIIVATIFSTLMAATTMGLIITSITKYQASILNEWFYLILKTTISINFIGLCLTTYIIEKKQTWSKLKSQKALKGILYGIFVCLISEILYFSPMILSDLQESPIETLIRLPFGLVFAALFVLPALITGGISAIVALCFLTNFIRKEHSAEAMMKFGETER